MPVGVVENGSVLIEAENARFNENDPLITLVQGDGGRDNGNGDHILFAPNLGDGENLGAPQGEGVTFEIEIGEDDIGVYDLELELSRFTGSDENDKGNDVFIGADGPGGQTLVDLLDNTGDNEVNFINDANGNPTTKLFANGFGEAGVLLNNSFVFAGEIDGEDPTGATEGNFPAQVNLTEAGTYSFTVFARSDNVGLDSFALTEPGAERATEENFADDNQGDDQIVADDFIFELVDTDNDSVVATLQDGGTIGADDVPAAGSLVLTSRNGAQDIDSVTITSDGQSRTESVEPFAQFGDSNGDFFDGKLFEEGTQDFQISVQNTDGTTDEFDFSFDVVA